VFCGVVSRLSLLCGVGGVLGVLTSLIYTRDAPNAAFRRHSGGVSP
jgi:hypothetical protein